MRNKLLAIGECMLELSGKIQLGSQAKLNFGGDVLNTALYYARLDGKVSFLTALGDDDFSTQMINQWQSENIDTSTVLRLKNTVPGLYAIQTDNFGERNFYYWREQAPIKQLFYNITKDQLNSYINNYQYLYFSGISLSRWDESQLEIFISWLKEFKNADSNKKIIFDLNYRPKCWQSKDQAKIYLKKILKYLTIVITTFEDEQLLFDDTDYQQTLTRYNKAGIETIIIKRGAKSTVVSANSEIILVDTDMIKPIDTTAAGDSFNAAFLAGLDRNIDIQNSVKFAQSFAAEIIQHHGAIIDKKYTDIYLKTLKEP
ncbi:sugar kinase [Allofrancisella guangzhouensis]|uniref:2-dehydro-3-deoxygluconokinase n=1 Tax=Allofrancisella guangzhouensis TaxID=594679 RepID=A0A0A8EAB4_9GAMM|nr:sugar kinase [Allofrancisella guangzhouensis]AJC49076.1 2-dehydro-3-deoxygluconokinase [Allofrancisella guangzhouensis]MBK2026907.1 sugar kinase [Allofrancisella guangzhouensis]MBK2044370.1 sugar kinase [Allofrancisella guangzhouensis]MBK2046274.1 sugar kinase [Allofrancisella guangzhouensis]